MHPLLIFFLLLVGLPLIELYVLIEIGARIGALPTIFLAILTAIIGATLMRAQGLRTLAAVRAAAERGEPPALQMLDGLLLLVGGGVLLFPGFLTDALGFLLLVPPFRRWLIRRWVIRMPGMAVRHPADTPHRRGRTIDGEYRRLDE